MYSPTLKDKLIIQPGAPVIEGDTIVTADNDNSDTDISNTDLSPENPSISEAMEDGQ